MSPSTRRAFLAAAGVAGGAAVAGCSGIDALSSEQHLTYTLNADRLDSSITELALRDPPEEPRPWTADYAETIDAAVAGERPTTYGYPPVPADEYVERDGTYYQLQVVTTGLERIERPVLTLEWVGQLDDLDDPPERVRFPALTRLDQHAVKAAFVAARHREMGGQPPKGIAEEGGYVYRRGYDGPQSAFAPEPLHDHVEFSGVVLAVSVEQRELAEPARTGVAIPVADSPAQFERAVDGETVDTRLDPSTLSDNQRSMLYRDQYEETTPLSDGFRSLLVDLGLGEYLDAVPEEAPEADNGLRLAFGEEYYRYGLYVNPAD
ncbi:twin-arginine translocation signal domain-containing protein [Halosimplex sp. J119]